MRDHDVRTTTSIKRNKVMRSVILCCAFVGILPWVYSQNTPDTTYTNLEPEDFYILMKSTDNHVLIDTRTLREYRKERIPGAQLLEGREELARLIKDLDFEQPVLVYCSDNYRSPTASMILADEGFLQVYNLLGGLTEWKRSGLETDKKRLSRKKAFNR